MRKFLKWLIPLRFRVLILRGLNYFSDRQALSLPLPASLRTSTKFALVSYVTAPFRQGSGSTLFTHAGVPKLMVAALHELGYSVELIEWSNTVFAPQKDYDLFIGHAGRNFERIAERLSRDCTKIYFSTGTYWKEHNRSEEQRFAALESRRSLRLPYDRWINDSEEGANEAANGIICLGNHVARESYCKFPLVINLNNATYHTEVKSLPEKDHKAGRANFLFLASLGNVHKGLDLLLEAFSQPELQSKVHLYICQIIRPDFLSLYKNELENTPNIHLIGHIDLQSKAFQELVMKCSFVIHPSCAEGQPGAVLDCMRYGLIPVLTRENNIDIGEYGFEIFPSVIDIAEKIVELSQSSVEDCTRLAGNARRATSTCFSEENFLHNIKVSIQSIVDSHVRQRTDYLSR